MTLRRVLIILIAVAAGLVVAAVILWRASPDESLVPPDPLSITSPLQQAIHRATAARGEPVGLEAEVTIPRELQHYRDRRLFLRIQRAAAQSLRLELPHDYAHLAELMLRREINPVEPLGADYALFGVGYFADEGPFTHFDRATGLSIPLFPNDEDYANELSRLEAEVRERAARVDQMAQAMKSIPSRESARRREARRDLRRAQQDLDASRRLLRSIREHLESPAKRALLREEYEMLNRLAESMHSGPFDLNDGYQRKEVKVALLRGLRPHAMAMLAEIAAYHRAVFDRHLLVTSLVRTEEYQRRLRVSNPNATVGIAPPHVTGLAFDVLYEHMTAAEQVHLFEIAAAMKRAMRIEVLRETRNHVHVFAFVDREFGVRKAR